MVGQFSAEEEVRGENHVVFSLLQQVWTLHSRNGRKREGSTGIPTGKGEVVCSGARGRSLDDASSSPLKPERAREAEGEESERARMS